MQQQSVPWNHRLHISG